MENRKRSGTTLQFHPVTKDRLSDLALFSTRHGRFGYCSCMQWRMTSGEFRRSSKEERAAALEKLVARGIPVGVLAYSDGEPVAWCSIAPRETYAALERYRALPRLDDAPVWSAVCFFVDRRFRRQGITSGLPRAGVEYARSEGAKVVEGYPAAPDARLYKYMGTTTAFLQAGFTDVTPEERHRHVMRFFIGCNVPQATG